jgi:uncharacterized protein
MATATREFQVLAKPIGAVCNLDCRYCYYLEKKDLYPQAASFRMADDLLESYIAQHIAACPKETVLFSWHGGEPTVLGIDYLRRIVELQRKHRPPGREVINGIQTNGTLIDEAWCRFLAHERFYVGLSIDGPRELHDRYRVTKSQKATHKQVMQAYRLLRRHRVSTDVLCVVHQHNVRHPAAVYRFFRDLGVEYLQFLPLVQRRGDGVSAETVAPEAYGTFLCTVFNEWVRNDIERMGIQNFEEASRPFLGIPHALCILRETCGDIVVLEHNGDVYECDHFVTGEHRLGNLRETPLLTLLESSRLRAFGDRKRDALPRYCLECEVLYQCHGGCPKDRLARAPDGEVGLNHLCAGFKRFFNHCGPYLQRMAQARRSGTPMTAFMSALRSEHTKTAAQAGRNDPCPCGSGRKYKRCCLAN